MESEFGRVIGALPGLVWTARTDGDCDFLNRRWFEYTGFTREQALGSGWVIALHAEDRPRMLAFWQACLTSGTADEIEGRLRRFDGVYRWFHFRVTPVTGDDGSIVRWCGLNTDIEDRKRAEDAKRADEALRAREREQKRIIDSTPALIWTSDIKGRVESVNQTYVDYVGMPLDQMPRQGWEITHPDDLDRLMVDWRNVIASGETGQTEARLRRHDGVYRWFLFRASPMRDDRGNIVKWYGVATDIEDRKHAEAALKQSEHNLQLIIDAAPAQLWSTTPDGQVVSINRHYLNYVGMPLEQALGWGWLTAIHPDDQDALADVWRTILAMGVEGHAEARLRRHDGTYRWFLMRASPQCDESGNIVRWYGASTDIEDRKRAERSLQFIIDATPVQLWSTTPEGAVESVNRHYLDYVGVSMTETLGWGWQDAVHPDDRKPLADTWRTFLATGAAAEAAARYRRHDGTYRWFLLRAAPIRDESGSIVRWYGVSTDIEDRMRAENELRHSEAFLAQGEAVSETGSFLWRLETNEIRWSEQLRRLYEFVPGERITLKRIAKRMHPDDLWINEAWVALARAGRDCEYDHRLLMPEGEVKYLHFVGRALRDREGKLEYVGVVQDVTERRLAEQALSKVRSELAHVSRVSSLGALTASIAHEVNQPLAGIVTNASTCLRMLGSDPPNVEGARETARRTIRDGNRAAEVITRLRALFGKKEGSFEVVDLNEAAREVVALSMHELQTSRVVLRQDFADDLPSVSGDRVQLQQVILNLILNATDAMSEINERLRVLTIKTELDEDGHVRLSVQDSGVGTDAQSAAKLFEAFYTTKPGGMGIGLSVSRSIIDRHQGRIWASANDGPGAKFSFSIPCGADVRADTTILRASILADTAPGTSST